MTSTSMTTATAVRRGRPRPEALGSGGWTTALTSLLCTVATGLRLPTSSHDTRFDREDPALEAEPEQGCCPCQHSPPGQALPALEAQEVTFQKKFENFLHHAITIPKCDQFWEGLGAVPCRGWDLVGGAYYGVGLALVWVGSEAGRSDRAARKLRRFPRPPQGPMESDIHQQESPKVSWDRCGDGGRGSENRLYLSDSSHFQGFGEAPPGSWASQTSEKQLRF